MFVTDLSPLQPGLYVFQFHALSHSTSQMWLELHHNYNYVASIYGHVDNDYAAGGKIVMNFIKGPFFHFESYSESPVDDLRFTVYRTFYTDEP